MSKRDYYEVLGVDRDAGPDEIKRAYRRLAHKYHPDKNAGDKTSEEQFKEATEAYEILNNAEKRAAYDRFGVTGERSGFGGSARPGSDRSSRICLRDFLEDRLDEPPLGAQIYATTLRSALRRRSTG